ncbi:hypothetical protein QTP88_020037 [Uroleucon formosanum]
MFIYITIIILFLWEVNSTVRLVLFQWGQISICSNCKLALPPPTYGNCERVALACVALVLRSWSCRSPWFRNRNRLHHNSLRCM